MLLLRLMQLSATLFSPNLIGDVVDKLFPVRSCLCYVRNNGSLLWDGEIFANYQAHQWLVVNVDNLKVMRTPRFRCRGYLVAATDEVARDIFATNLINNFRPHNPLLLITDVVGRYEELERALVVHDLDTIIVAGLNSTTYKLISLGLNRTINSSDLVDYKRLTRYDAAKILRQYGHYLRIGASQCPPYVSNSTGVDMDILNVLVHNLPVEFKFIKDQFQLNSLLTNNLVDVVTCGKWQRELLFNDVDVSSSYVYMCTTFLVPLPRPMSLYLQPFDDSLWLCYIGIVGLFSVALHLARNEDSYGRTFADTLRLTVLSSLGRMPGADRASLRLILITWTLGCILIATYYSAGLTAMLHQPRFTVDIRTMQHMVDHHLPWISRDDYFKHFLESGDTGVLKQVGKLFRFGDKLQTNQGVLAYIPFAHIKSGYVITEVPLTGYDKNHLRVLSENFACFHGSFFLRANSPYTALFDDKVARLNEHGFLIYWYRKFVRVSKNKLKLYHNRPTNIDHFINVENMQGALYALLISYTVCLLIFLVELLSRLKPCRS